MSFLDFMASLKRNTQESDTW